MTAGNAILIVAIVTGLGLIGALFFVMFKIRQISREFFGTSSLIEGLKRQEALEDDTPKSVSVGTEKTMQDIGAVADGFSDLCVEVLQERGRHVRTVMGTRNMPNHNIPVEVELIFRLADGYGEEDAGGEA